MTKTSWSRFSKLALACLVVLTALAAPVAAVSVGEEDVPSDAQVESKVTTSVTLNELYKNPQLESWTLAGSTELTDVTWTVTYYDQTGAKINQESFDGQNFSGATVAADDGTSKVEIRVAGTAPSVDSYKYDPAQTFDVIHLQQTREGGSSNDIETWTTHHYTEESQSARDALDESKAAVEGVNSDEAQASFDNAVSAFENGNFELATELANEAQTKAQQAEQSSQTQQMLIYAAGGLLAIAVVVGGVFYWRSQQSGYDKLG
ncbi:hypothetical protein GL213_03180 [Halogeometricum borinquense]|uniref:Uncharacterized protein n=2 Tax=Halogeometricum borinquense TaxID=60847 RepID=E4NN11_HALBP|nr:hypothetical protein [Halogeometricum borinquense]ADQ66241.1 hypothetical protein Hbor_06410 [Halogeometricum borinquense DSM 11551]ELY27263.1 hypothetical protein C499_09379 [Halogeometricum borinquense DSM 11551]QIB75797.1 hypothetical protein G3I44_16845 [Halogeometricum borinquense]QIQ75622.1 hypothetical protein GL213_03180 [Halogeometricum borinquense]